MIYACILIALVIIIIFIVAAFEYTPGIVRKLVNPHQSTSLRVQHDSYVKNGKVIIGYVDEISQDAKSVLVNNEHVSNEIEIENMFLACNVLMSFFLVSDFFFRSPSITWSWLLAALTILLSNQMTSRPCID